MIKQFEHPQMVDDLACPGPFPDDWRKWPDSYRDASIKAVQKTIDEHPGAKIFAERSLCILRGDLSGVPWMLYRSITLEIPEA